MTEANPLLVGKVRQGRSIAYEIRWASNYRMAGDWYEDASLRDEIRKTRAARDREVQATSARRGTPAGSLAYRLSTTSRSGTSTWRPTPSRRTLARPG